MLILRRVLLAIVAVFLAWLVIVFGIGEYYLGRASKGDASAVEKAYAWNPRHPDALYRQSRAIEEDDPAGSKRLLQRSFAENPASSFPLLALADRAKEAGDRERADRLIEIAAELMPANPPIWIIAGNYWANAGNTPAALTHWSQAIEADLQTSEKVFPVLLELAEEPGTIGLLQSLTESPPSWWEHFFRYAIRQARELETVRTLYAFRRAAKGVSLTRNERHHYVRRLKQEGRITEAYLVWVNGLDKAERAYLGVINNRGFELEPTNTGFDWHIENTRRVTAALGITDGIEGRRALHLVFEHRKNYYRHVYQPLFLDPQVYRVRGKVRVDSLDSLGGLKWIVRCVLPQRRLLGESRRFLGSSEWREFSFEIRVPPACVAQEIRLVSAGRRPFEYEMTGDIWFDTVSMRKIITPRTKAESAVSESPRRR